MEVSLAGHKWPVDALSGRGLQSARIRMSTPRNMGGVSGLRSAALVRAALLSVAMGLLLTSCSGGAEPRKLDAGGGADGGRSDAPIGQDAATDRPYDGAGGATADGAV